MHLPARPLPALLLLLLPALLLGACGPEDRTYSIEEVRENEGTPTSEQTPKPGRKWTYSVPDSWTALPASPSRALGWKVGGRDDATCTLTVLQGDGGGLAANVNRWRRQMKLEPAPLEEIQALPRPVPLLGGPAALVDLEGTYVGMGGQNVEDARMLGLLLIVPKQVAVFLKMVGPKSAIDGEREAFLELAASLDLERGAAAEPTAAGPGMPRGHGMERGHAQRASAPKLAWKVPSDWTQQPPRMMREGTWKTKDGAEVWVSIAGGDLLMNVNRWRGQMNQPPIDAAAVEALPRLEALGQKGYVLHIEGNYGSGGMGQGGPQQLEDAAMLVFALPRGDRGVFVKMIGKADAVKAGKAEFEAFCRSLEGK